MKQQPPWVHTPEDGRGVRKVLIDGQEIKMAVFALITERLHGRVEVVWQTSS